MGVYLYCLGDPDHPAPQEGAGAGEPLRGIEGAPVRATAAAGFAAWVSDLERAPSATLERIRAHNAVIETAAADVTPLPLRFGQWFESEAALEASLQERRDGLRDALRRVAGAMEFGVRVVDPASDTARRPAEPGDRSSGTAYLEGLVRRERRAEEERRRGAALARELEAWLEGRVRETRARPAGSEGLVAIAHLVDRHDTREYRLRVGEFPERHPELRFVFSGPWPPYGFVK